MTRCLILRLCVLACASGLVTAGCFTDPINQAPTVNTMLPMPPSTIFHGGSGSLTFTVSDPDHDALDVTWGAEPGACPDSFEGWPHNPVMSGQVLPVGPSVTQGPFCVCTFVTDSHKAADQSCLTVMPDNHLPVPMINVVEPAVVVSPTGPRVYPLFSRFRLAAVATDLDVDDMVTFSDWRLSHEQATSQATLVDCPDEPSQQCFTADQPGDYHVSVVASDGFEGNPIATRTLTVASDRKPCLGESEPSLTMPLLVASAPDPMKPAQDVRFVIKSVSDDGDTSFVGMNKIHFTWWEGPEVGPLIDQTTDSSVFTEFADLRLLGQTRRVRVEISDRNAAAVNDVLRDCKDEPTCSDPAQPGCLLRMTWTIRYQ